MQKINNENFKLKSITNSLSSLLYKSIASMEH